MSTRCQVQVTDGEDKLTMYHHYDGYPDNILKQLQSGYNKGIETIKNTSYMSEKDALRQRGYMMTRAYKASAFIIASEPDGFEPLDYHDRHGDIEWFYTVHVFEEAGKPKWTVDVEKVYDESVVEGVDLMALTDDDINNFEKTHF